MEKVIIIGSSRKDGETKQVVSQITEFKNWDVIDLNDYNFSYYDYNHENKEDDYSKLIVEIVEKYEILIFATPVYWYSMSGIMKVFFDRLTDLLTVEKKNGRKLRGKYMAVISSSEGDNLGENFWIPFEKTAEYLGMNFICGVHTVNNKDQKNNLKKFIKRVEKIS